jgi:hypothetical protein
MPAFSDILSEYPSQSSNPYRVQIPEKFKVVLQSNTKMPPPGVFFCQILGNARVAIRIFGNAPVKI